MPYQLLKDRTIISLSGPDTANLLQGLITTNIDDLQPNQARPGALLTPQGKIAFDFLISKSDDQSFLIDLNDDLVQDFEMKLKLYKLRANVDILHKSALQVAAIWDEPITSDTLIADMRFSDKAVFRFYGEAFDPDAIAEGQFGLLRIDHGVAESGFDFNPSDIFPHDIYFDLNGAIDFKKGCYVGQEVVSRMQHRGTARRRLAILTADHDLGDGTDIMVNGKSVGSFLNAIGSQALAIVRVDRVTDGLANKADILVKGQKVTLTFPKIADQLELDGVS